MTMERSRFEAIVGAYGADPARWPQGERDAALDFVRAHPETAGAALRREADLDGLLEEARLDPQPRSGLEDRLARAIPSSPRGAASLPDWAAMAAGLALFAGFGAGWGLAEILPAGKQSDELYLAAFDALSEDNAWSLEDM